MTKIGLQALYGLWDALGDVPVNEAGNRLDEEFLHFASGADLTAVWHWFEAQNPRFSVADVMQGLRLTPVTACADRAMVLDSDGRQVCMGDELNAQINAGKYGRMRDVIAMASQPHLPDGLMDAVSVSPHDRHPSGVETIAVSSIDENSVRLGREHSDYEHGYQETVRIAVPAAPMPVNEDRVRPRQKA